MHRFEPAVFFGLIGLLSAWPAPAGRTAEGHIVSGTLTFQGVGPLHLYLVDEQTFRRPYTGLQHLVIDPSPEQRAKGKLAFRFRGVAPGVYGLRCFQDENRNGKLDRGLFGPSEPWGMSFRGERPWGRPAFEEIAFRVERDRSDLRIVVE